VGESGDKGNRVEDAIEDALNSPLLDVSIDGAKGALIHICGGNDMTLAEANSVAKKISEKMDVNNAMVIWGARVNDEFEGYLRVMLLITGIKSPQIFGKNISNVQSFRSNDLTKNINGSKLSNDILNIRELSID
jgi:cell division protein FtsZ